jgi:mycofactocin system glycosyltransferase
VTRAAVVADSEPIPLGFRVEVDDEVTPLSSGGWFGGRPGRVMRLTDAGAAAWEELRSGPIRSRRAGLLARRLTDAGIAHPVPVPLESRPDVTVIVPVRDRSEQLDRCLASVGDGYPIIVVDDASADELAIRTVATTYGAQVIRLDANVGAAQARNVASAQVDTELIAYVDSDTIPGHEWISALAAHFADGAVAAVAPRIVPRSGSSWSGRYTRARCNLDLGSRPARVVPYGRVSYLPTAALLVRRKAVFEVAHADGVFDPAMPIGEDVDLVWRLHEAGWRVRYDPAHQVPHQEPSSWPALLRRRYRYGTSTPLLALRHRDAMAPLFLHPAYGACAAALATRRPATAVVALAAAVHSLRASLRAAGVPDADLPTRAVVNRGVHGVVDTWTGMGRYAVQFAAPLLALALLRRRSRAVATGLALAPAVSEWCRRTAPIDPARFLAGYFADEVAYGAGVVSGCVTARTLVPLRPILVRRSL